MRISDWSSDVCSSDLSRTGISSECTRALYAQGLQKIGGMTMRRLCLLTAATLLLAGAPAAAQEAVPRKVDLELCLAVDGSGSIQEDEFAFQRQASAQAVSHPAVVGLLTSGFELRLPIAPPENAGI